MICSSIIGDGKGEGVRGRLLNIGSSSLKLELSPDVVVVNNGESVVIGIKFDIWFSSFDDNPSIDGLSKLIDDERDKFVGWVSEAIKLPTKDDAVAVRPVRFGTRTRSIP